MKKSTKPAAYALSRGMGFLFVSTLIFSAGCKKFVEPKQLKDFDQVVLVANKDGYGASHIDATLQNPWGLTFSTTGTPWVNSTGGHVSEVYDKDGAPLAARPAVNVPSPTAATGGLPTGIVFNGGTDFKLTNGNPARFIFVGVDGILSGWNTGNNAQLIKNNSATSAYTGLALSNKNGLNYLYAANFRAGRIDVWDANFAPVLTMPFMDDQLPAGYAPYNVQAVGSWLYVTYAKVGPDGHDQAGAGNGYVDIYGTDGTLSQRFIKRGSLNSPWGIAEVPSTFLTDESASTIPIGKLPYFGNKGGMANEPIILVGNFGDGHINAYHQNGDYIGPLKVHGAVVTIYGLWAISLPPVTATTVDPNRLYYTAGPNLEKDGIFGYLLKK